MGWNNFWRSKLLYDAQIRGAFGDLYSTFGMSYFFGQFLMFLWLPSFLSFLVGVTYGHNIPGTDQILLATRSDFLETFFLDIDTPGSAHLGLR